MSYNIYNNLVKLHNRDLTEQSGGESFSVTKWIQNVTFLFHIRSTESVSTKVNAGKMLIIFTKFLDASTLDVFFSFCPTSRSTRMSCIKQRYQNN